MAQGKLKELQSKNTHLQKDLKSRSKECEDLEVEKRGKERQLKSHSTIDDKRESEILEKQLQRELKEKEEELDRIKMMIRDKKVQRESKVRFGGTSTANNDNIEEDDE